jgi:hypothetical protein
MLELLRGPDVDVLVPDAVLDELRYLDPHDPVALAARSMP